MFFNIKTGETYSREQAAAFFARQIESEYDGEAGAIAAEEARPGWGR